MSATRRPRAEQSSGLDNMRVRAEALGGTFSIGARPGGGTLVAWMVPLGTDAAPIDEIGTQGPI